MSVEIFTRFKSLYPRHGAKYNPKLTQWYQAAIENFRSLPDTSAPVLDPKLKALYDDWKSGRGVNPKKPTKALKSKIKAVLAHFPGTTGIWIQGSRAIGDWVDNKTPKDKLKLREKVTGKTKVPSDWDFYIEPVQATQIGDIHIMVHKTSEAKKIYGNV